MIIPFLLSASWVVFSAHLYFRMISLKLRRSFLLSPSDVNRLPRFAVTTLYQLRGRQSLVAGFYVLVGFYGVGLLASLPEGGVGFADGGSNS